MDTIYGIDLGTTQSAIGYVDGRGQTILIPNAEGAFLTPSSVWFAAPGEVVIGTKAAHMAATQPADVVEQAKRHMGKNTWIWEFFGEFYRARDIASLVLKKLKQDAEHHLKRPVRHVVITVPAHFTELQRAATIEAGQHAGLNVVQLLNEPTAAALASHAPLPQNGWFAVVDIGGGTFDLSLMEAINGDIYARSTCGKADLGGNDWDGILLHHMAVSWLTTFGYDPLDQPEHYQTLKETACQIKHLLSVQEQVTVSIELGQHRMPFSLTAKEFEASSKELLQQMEDTTKRHITKLPSGATLQAVLLAGGTTHIPMIERHIESWLNLPCKRIPEPEYAIVKGAARYAASLSISDINGQDDTKKRYLPGASLVVDINNHPLGLVVLDSFQQPMVDMIIPQYSQLPYKASYTYYTAHEQQISIDLQLVEGSSPIPEECLPLGQATLTGLTPQPAETPVTLHFTYDKSGVLSVDMVDTHNGSPIRATIQRKTDRSYHERERMMRLLLAHTIQ